MIRVFADTHFFLAFLNTRDRSHDSARRFRESNDVQLVTTLWVLAEILDALSSVAQRAGAGRFVQKLQVDANVLIVPAEPQYFESGFRLYVARPDKSWSLTDCISFEVMRAMGLTEVLTGDRDFEQAGFTRLLP